ncbi:conserved hypothetical protein [Vibrio coralliirubri]|uniref:hypothetical protein n=1 Tax=Vibrio coralliirubri TaxID=1516159 RepID=UPI00062ED223|nr:hypothetical protein [Vibrio coralliirubri]CDT33461.1 conserved hypothetical protein [Vibrio coralliirubri]
MATANNGGIAVELSGKNNRLEVLSAHKVRSALTPLLEKILYTTDPLDLDLDVEYIFAEKVELKIDYNCLNVYSELIRENSTFLFIVEEAIEAFDNENPNYRKRFLRTIHMKYKEAKREVMIENNINTRNEVDVISCIKNNSDILISSVRNKIFDDSFSNLDFCVESLQMARDMIVCYGFINCKILEVPVE